MADIKNFLYAWCGKKKLTPNYDIRAAGNKNRQKFLCEVRVSLLLASLSGPSTWCSGSPESNISNLFTCHSPTSLQVRVDSFNYIGMGNSTNKKDAQTNAARDFVNYLVRIGQMNAAEVPALGVRNLLSRSSGCSRLMILLLNVYKLTDWLLALLVGERPMCGSD